MDLLGLARESSFLFVRVHGLTCFQLLVAYQPHQRQPEEDGCKLRDLRYDRSAVSTGVRIAKQCRSLIS